MCDTLLGYHCETLTITGWCKFWENISTSWISLREYGIRLSDYEKLIALQPIPLKDTNLKQHLMWSLCSQEIN